MHTTLSSFHNAFLLRGVAYTCRILFPFQALGWRPPAVGGHPASRAHPTIVGLTAGGTRAEFDGVKEQTRNSVLLFWFPPDGASNLGPLSAPCRWRTIAGSLCS